MEGKTFQKYFSKDELQLVYLLFRQYTHSLPPRDVILHVLELRVKVISSSYMGAQSVHVAERYTTTMDKHSLQLIIITQININLLIYTSWTKQRSNK